MVKRKPLWRSLDDPRRVSAVRKMCADGYTGAEVAAAMETSEETITMLRLRHGIRPGRGCRIDCHLAPERRAIIIEMTVAGCGDAEIAAELGITPGTVRRHRGAYRLPSNAPDIELRPSTVDRMMAMWRGGNTQREIAAALGVHRTTIRRYFARLGREWGRANVGGRPNTSLRTEVVRLVTAGTRPSEIARRTNRSRSAISNLLKRLRNEGVLI